MGLRSKLKRVRKIARAIGTGGASLLTDKVGLTGDPRSLFYGDPVEVEPENAGEAIGHVETAEDTVPAAVVESAPTDEVAAARLSAFQQMSSADRAAVTLLPPLATWNAFVILNPMIGRVLASSLNYMLLKSLNDYPFQGKNVLGVHDANDPSLVTVTIDSYSLGASVQDASLAYVLGKYVAVPFFRFTIASSTLNAQSGGQVTINLAGYDAQRTYVDTAQKGYEYTFQRTSTTEAVIGVYIPTQVVATRTLPFLPIAGDDGDPNAQTVVSPTLPRSIVITFSGVSATDQVSVTIPGYASAELREIARMYALPAGDVR